MFLQVFYFISVLPISVYINFQTISIDNYTSKWNWAVVHWALLLLLVIQGMKVTSFCISDNLPLFSDKKKGQKWSASHFQEANKQYLYKNMERTFIGISLCGKKHRS